LTKRNEVYTTERMEILHTNSSWQHSSDEIATAMHKSAEQSTWWFLVF